MEEGASLNDFLVTYDKEWRRMRQRCTEAKSSSSSATLASLYLPIFSNDHAKAVNLFFALPSSYDNVVDNLTSKTKDVSYDEAHQRLTALKSSNEETPASASRVSAGGSKSNNRASPSSSAGADWCTWCKKQGLHFEGHVWTDCKGLKKSQADKKKKKTAGKKEKPADKTEDEGSQATNKKGKKKEKESAAIA